ncbi:MAG: OmpA family protein [Pseudomonadota bacterium]
MAGIAAALAAGGATALATLGGLTGTTTETFRFSRGTALATGEDARLRGVLADVLADARIAVTIVGHSGTQGDAAANLALSVERAEAVAAIAREMGVAAARLTVTGVGGGDPLPRTDGQSDRAFEAALARVDVALQVRR